MRSGFVALVGRPNVGKSTLLNAILERKIAITSNVSGTTRNIIQGIYNDLDSQIIFIDLPGIHKPQNKLGKQMNEEVYTTMHDVDIVFFLIDVTKSFGTGDQFILDKLKELKKPIFLLMNKVDLVEKSSLLEKISEYQTYYPFDEIIPLSALKNDNVSDVIQTTKKYLKDEIKYYSSDEVTNISKTFYIAEIVREKLFQLTKDEIPHSITCFTETLKEDKEKAIISVEVIIDRENIKKIIIGKNGSMLKKVGILARKEIEEFLGKRVFLETHVKVIENWKDREKYLKELGFYELEL